MAAESGISVPAAKPSNTYFPAIEALDARYPGLRHRIVDEQDRIRKHIRFFVNGEMAERLDRALGCGDEVMIVAALSGG